MRHPSILAGACVLALTACRTAHSGEGDGAALALKAQQILKANCYRCHGQEGAVEGGLNYVLDFKTLVARKKVVPKEPARSSLYKRIISEDDPMPPAEEKVRPSKEEIAVLKQWIAAGAPALSAGDAPRSFVSEEQVAEFLVKDLKELAEEDRRFTRYFTITHLYNAGLSDDQLKTYRHGLAKLVNSLSWGRRIVFPKPIDPAHTILRIDLRDLKWSVATWTRLMTVYPYSVLVAEAPGQALARLAEGEPVAVRADWFVHAASRPPLYHEMLGLPWSDRALEKELRVDVATNIEAGQVARAGFNSSGISRYNRLIERHEGPYGSYWKSYDFAGNADQQNLFAYPFGPGKGARDFQHDGSEIIFTLPNGLQGYMLVDGKGARINEAPTQIVSDPRQQNRAVVNGISCMSCHMRGIIAKADQIRDHAAKNPAAFSEREAILIKTLYPPKEKFAGLMQEDAERFKAAVEKTGGRVTTTDPVVALASRFEIEMDLGQAAAELCMRPEDFSKRLGKSAQLARTLGALNVDGGTVHRSTFEAVFGQAIRELGVGLPRSLTNSVGMRLNYIPPGEFLMGSPDDETEARSNERPQHKVRITKPFFMGVHLVTQEQYQRVVGKSPSWFKGDRMGIKDLPVDSVTWDDVIGFCDTLTARAEEKRAGRRYRLPTEAEWEYACRAGTTTRFIFGDQIGIDQANFGGRYKRSTRVGGFPGNRFGLFDMHGNLYQWCSDWYEGAYYKDSPTDDPRGPKTSTDGVRIQRGGAWGDSAFALRSASRSGGFPNQGNRGGGFRVVCIFE
jgi:formylglycine-generating enzyme required for sulfatase activity/mono/diheme cytochrome c family protein